MDAVETKIAEHKKQREALDAARRTAEARQAEVEASQPEEKKELAKIKEEIRGLTDRRSALQKDLGRLEAQMEMASAASPRAGRTFGREAFGPGAKDQGGARPRVRRRRA